MIVPLQSLRGIFAFLIFLHHFKTSTSESLFPAGGDFGVAFFFMLSGFVMCAGYLDKLKGTKLRDFNFKYFYGRRVNKLYPLHFLCFLWALALSACVFTVPDFFNLLLLQAWIPDKEFYFSANAVSWCLTDFLFFYMVFPVLGFMVLKNRNRFVKISLAVSLIYAIGIIPFISTEFYTGFIYINPLTRLLDFILGIDAWLLYENLKSKSLKYGSKGYILQLATLFLAVVTCFVWKMIPEQYSYSVIWWPAVFAIILVFSLYVRKGFLTIKPLVWFGDFSFTFYMIHILGINSFDILLSKTGIELNSVVRFILILTVDIAGAFLISRFFEKPSTRFLDNLLKKKALSQKTPATNPEF